jgi:GxxExxY protein
MGGEMAELLYKEEAYAIVGAAMEVYNELGHGFLEAVYQEALALELTTRGIPFVQQTPVTISYKGQPLRQHYVPDFIAYGKIILELKAIQKLGPNEEAQLLNYLKATGLRLGVLLNFGHPDRLEWVRRIL